MKRLLLIVLTLITTLTIIIFVNRAFIELSANSERMQVKSTLA